MADVWTGSRGELSHIEFRPPLSSVAAERPPSSAETLGEAAESWITGQSPAIERMRARATSIARDGAAVVVIHGEPGAGKLRATRWMHRCGNRSARPLLLLDAGDRTIHAQLDRVLEALAGDGAMVPGTIALRNCEGADPGTLERLSQVLGRQGVELVCALFLLSKFGPEQLRETSTHHAQLLGRAGAAVVAVPALRHRSGDACELARVFAHDAARRYDKSIRGLSPQALSKLDGHDFPGNVRELQAMVEQAVLRSSGDWVTAEGFPGLGDSSVRASEGAELVIRLPGSSLREIEIEALRLALKLADGRIVRASELLGITRHALRRKLEKFGLNDLRAT